MRTITMFDGADNAITFDIPDDFRYVEASSDLAGDYPAVWYRDVEFVPYINSDISGGKFTLGEAGANIVFSAIHDGDETANFTNLDELRDWAESFPYDPRDPDRERDAEANGD